MAFARGSGHGMRFIREAEFGVTPQNPDMRSLRHTSSSLVLNKDSFQSNELRKDAQISDLRHGVKQVNGDVGIEFSYGEFDDFLAAAVRGRWADNVLVAGIEDQYFTVERIFNDIKKVETFTGCAVNTFSLDIQTNAMVTGTINFIGKGARFSDDGVCREELPSFTHSPLDGFHGALREGGVEIAVITGINLSIDNAIEAANVVGSDEAAALVSGRINVSGSVSAYFQDMDLLDKFVNEVESELEITLGDGGPGSYIVYLPRIKYSGGTNSVDGEGPITLDMPFQALLDDCTGTNIKITRIPAEDDTPVPCVLTFGGTGFSEGEPGVFEPVTLSLEGKKFNGADGKELPGVQLDGLPAGLKCAVVRTGENTAEARLSGEPADRTNPGAFTLTLAASAFAKGFCHCEGFEVTGRTQDFTITWTDRDMETPTLVSSVPANGATNVPADTTIVLTFSEDIQAGTGDISVSSSTNDIYTVDVANAVISGNEMSITLPGTLINSRKYSVTMPAGIVTDSAGNQFAGMTAGELEFTIVNPEIGEGEVDPEW